MLGTYVIIINTTNNTPTCGIKYLNIFGTLIFAMEDVTNKHTPSGGVTIPIVKLTARITPKCIGSMPAARHW